MTVYCFFIQKKTLQFKYSTAEKPRVTVYEPGRHKGVFQQMIIDDISVKTAAQEHI